MHSCTEQGSTATSKYPVSALTAVDISLNWGKSVRGLWCANESWKYMICATKDLKKSAQNIPSSVYILNFWFSLVPPLFLPGTWKLELRKAVHGVEISACKKGVHLARVSRCAKGILNCLSGQCFLCMWYVVVSSSLSCIIHTVCGSLPAL